MKKKIVNVLLSAAVVTSMMFAVTACGSKETGTSAPVDSATTESSVAEDNAGAESSVAEDNADTESTTEAESSDAAESTTADNAEASGNMTAEEWINSDTAASYVQLLDAMFGGQMTTAFEADGDTLVLAVTLTEEMIDLNGEELTDEQKEAMQTAMQQQYDSTADEFVPIRDELRDELGDDTLNVRIVYRISDGTELFSQDI